MSIIVTGGAGFIGSCIIRMLNDEGNNEIIIVDDIASTDKWMNLRNKRYLEYIPKARFLECVPKLNGVTAVIHMGADSSTTERNFDYLWDNNYLFTRALWGFCTQQQIPFLYASSAATYGDGSFGFDDRTDIDRLLPLNGYGYSKHLFDMWVKHQADEFPPQYVGLKFFNVYGPNEYCKGSMASMVYHGFRQIQESGKIRLFQSCHPDYADGEQLRDFIYVKDVCKVVLWFLKHPEVSGLFNVGTGRAQSFRELAEAIFHALGRTPEIEYVPMPEHLREKYQYYTKAEMDKLRVFGYAESFLNVEQGVHDYVKGHLNRNYEVF